MRIGIVDDHPLFRLGLRQALGRCAALNVRWDVDSGGEALRQIGTDPVDLVLVDLNLNGRLDGIAVTRVITEYHPRIQVAVISGLPGDQLSVAIAAGAAAFLPKYLGAEELVREVLRLGGRIGATVSGASRRVAPQLAGLSYRELEVLAEIRTGRTNREIAAELGISTTTVNKHVQQILRKLPARNRAQAAALLTISIEEPAESNGHYALAHAL